MSKKSGNVLKLKSPKSASTNPLHSGIGSAQRTIRKPGSSHSSRFTQSKGIDERTATVAPTNPDPPVYYHPWKSEYSQIFTRAKIQKSMTKDPYSSTIPSVTHANESITTEEECCSVLISPNAVHVEQSIIHQRPKSSYKSPFIVRYLRRNELFPSERPVPPTPIQNPSISQLQSEMTATIPVIDTNKISSIPPNLITTDRLLNRAKSRDDASVIRRPPRRLIMNITHSIILPLKVYG